MYIRIVIIITRYSGYAYNIILLCTLIINNTLCLFWYISKPWLQSPILLYWH